MPATPTTSHRMPPSSSRAPRPRIVPLTVDQYHRMIESGILAEDPGIELLNGMLVRKDRGAMHVSDMTVGPEHYLVVTRLVRLAQRLEKRGFHMRSQGPVTIPIENEPEPDGAIVRGLPEDYGGQHPVPDDLAAVFEVSDSSLAHDRTRKMRIYAGAGIPQYIIINIPDGQVEFYTEPVAAQQRYASVVVLKAEQKLRLNLAGRKFEVPVRKLLP
jgi:Uma2 family endonuclease